MSLSLAIALSLAAQPRSEPPPPPPGKKPPIVTRELAPPPIVAVPSPSSPPVLVPTPPPPPPPIRVAPPSPPPPPLASWQPARPRMPLIYYFTEDDYPVSALRNEEQGTTAFRLTVGANGRVSDCVVTSSSGSTALDAATCRILRARARFTPAANANGEPIASTVVSRTRWVLPHAPSLVVPDIELLSEATTALAGPGVEHPRPLDALANLFAAADYPAEAIAAATLADTDLQLAVAADGRVAGCTIAASSGLAALDQAACRVLTERARFAPAIRRGAGPVDSTLVARIHWREDPEEPEEEGEEEGDAKDDAAPNERFG